MMQTVLDTDILSELMKQNSVVHSCARKYLRKHSQLSVSIITRYEILRGLKAKNATRQIENFQLFSLKLNILPLNDSVVVKAAEIYADLKQAGKIIGDADILIAATAIVNGYRLSTNNRNHYQRISELKIDNWLRQ